ncbi:LysR family transcriptional regulator [Salinibacterium sp. ZJ77]|uniref:LysR family transcriptional regulator n=1 Tax=Salinibacterium sp. ZJ77 TaxID=2708337 RepID=UPI0014223E90|nr:LysR family transcriptional regulator [Salinibacterium sp. ZJ77]
MKIAHLRRFVAVAEELHFPRAAEALGIPLASLYTAIEKLEAEAGQQLITRGQNSQLTPAGRALLAEARAMIAAAGPEPESTSTPAGGKAKASKGVGRAPSVKGQPKPYKKRQGR